MNRTLMLIYILIILVILVSCSQNENTSNSSSNASIIVNDTSGTSKIYNINGEDIAIRKGPGERYNKIVNEKATRSFGETHYCNVDYSTKVEILEKGDTWSKIRVVDPAWLSDTYIGWIPTQVIITDEDIEKQSIKKLNTRDYEVIITDHNSAVQNFHVLLKRKKFDKNYVYQFIKAFRKEHCEGSCNVSLYDSKSIQSIIKVYPLEDKDYLKLADHVISISTFDAVEVRDWYPYQDFHYRELGGKNWKKEPLK